MKRLESFCWNSEAQVRWQESHFFLENALRLHKVLLPSNYYARGLDRYASTITVRRVSKLKVLAFKSRRKNIGSNEENTKCNTPGWCVELNLDLRNLDHSHPKEHDQEVTKLHQNNQLLHRHMSIDHWRHQDRVVMKMLQILAWNTPNDDGFTMQRIKRIDDLAVTFFIEIRGQFSQTILVKTFL